MNQSLPHEKLLVYKKALDVTLSIAPNVDAWPAAHSVRDQMDRACESLMTNLVKAAWQNRSREGIYHLECSLGSVLECAACLDIAAVKGLTDKGGAESAKVALQEIARMEVGLRKSWCLTACEESGVYGDKPQRFPHESLTVYQRSLQLCQTLTADILQPENLSDRRIKRVDEGITSLLLNIAEGNGRFSHLDHRQFLRTAEESGIKLAAYLDLMAARFPAQFEIRKNLLREIMAMLVGLKGYLSDSKKNAITEIEG